MLLEEWNMEDAKVVWQEEAREEGEKRGEKKGEMKGKKEIIDLLKSGKSPEDIIREYE